MVLFQNFSYLVQPDIFPPIHIISLTSFTTYSVQNQDIHISVPQWHKLFQTALWSSSPYFFSLHVNQRMAELTLKLTPHSRPPNSLHLNPPCRILIPIHRLNPQNNISHSIVFHWCLGCTSSSFTYDTSRHASISIYSLDILRFNLKQNKTDQLGVSTSIFLFRFNSWACSNRSKTSQDLFFTRLPLIFVTPTALKLLLLLPDKELQTTQWKFLATGLGPSLPQLCPYPTQWHPMSPFSSHPVRWRLCLY